VSTGRPPFPFLIRTQGFLLLGRLGCLEFWWLSSHLQGLSAVTLGKGGEGRAGQEVVPSFASYVTKPMVLAVLSCRSVC
jgi:hypothetical protein